MKISRVFLIVTFFAFQVPVFAFYEARDHPVVKPMPRSVLMSPQSKMKNFSTYAFRIKRGKKSENLEKKGKFWRLFYRILDANGKVDRSVSREEIVENYKTAALEKGGEITFAAGYILTFTLPREGGGATWVNLVARDGSYNLYIIDEAAFKRKLIFGAEEMMKALDEKGRIAVYGINFDTDKASLKLGAEKFLLEMVKLMKNNPDLKIEIQGHTDDDGSAGHNLQLSKSRAETVKNFLLAYGVASARMNPKGYGEEKPVAPNDTEENRAKNRRVELKKI